MAKLAHLDADGNVVNVSIPPETGIWMPPEGERVVWIGDDADAGIGDTFIDGKFTRPEPEPEKAEPATNDE